MCDHHMFCYDSCPHLFAQTKLNVKLNERLLMSENMDDVEIG